MARLVLTFLVAYATISLFGYQTAACMKKEEPRPQPTESPEEITTLGDTYETNCSSNDTLYGKCRNGGYCTVLINTIDGSRLSRCQCVGAYYGKYCERKRRTTSGSVYAVVGVAAVVFIAIVIGIAAIMKIRYDRAHRDERAMSESPGSPNGHPSAAATPFPLNSPSSQNGDARPPEAEVMLEESV